MIGVSRTSVENLFQSRRRFSEFVCCAAPARVPNKARRTEAPYDRKSEDERQHLDGDEREKQQLADGRCARDDSRGANTDPPEGKGRTHRAREAQEDARPALRAQVRAVAHLEPRLDAKEEGMRVPDTDPVAHCDLEEGLKRNRQDDRGGYDEAGRPSAGLRKLWAVTCSALSGRRDYCTVASLRRSQRDARLRRLAERTMPSVTSWKTCLASSLMRLP